MFRRIKITFYGSSKTAKNAIVAISNAELKMFINRDILLLNWKLYYLKITYTLYQHMKSIHVSNKIAEVEVI